MTSDTEFTNLKPATIWVFFSGWFETVLFLEYWPLIKLDLVDVNLIPY